MPTDASWEWDVLYYCGTVLLKMHPITFWRTSPRKLDVLTKLHLDINNPDGQSSSSGTKGYIDQVM